MKFLRQIAQFFFAPATIILTVSIFTIFILFTIFVPVPFVQNNETWIYSSSMQTLAALIALLPISYGYFINTLDDEQHEHLDSYIIDRMKSAAYYNMMTVILYSLIVIVINLLSFFFAFGVRNSFLIALLTIEGIGLISLYIYRLFDPNKVQSTLREFDRAVIDPNQKYISLDTFITKYLELETAVKDYLTSDLNTEKIDTMPLYDIVDNRSKDHPKIEEHYDTFKEIIFHRNNLIHNYTDTVVDYSKYEKIIELLDLFERYNLTFLQASVFSSVVKPRNTIVTCLKEYLYDQQNDAVEIGSVPEDFKEDIVSLLHSYFVSPYYTSLGLEDAEETDFEVIQNNYSHYKLIGIDVKSIQERNIDQIVEAYFRRLSSIYLYLFLINFDPKSDSFSIYYQTKDKEVKKILVP